MSEWEMFELITSAWYGKQCYFQQEDGTIYSRLNGRYMDMEDAIMEFATKISREGAE